MAKLTKLLKMKVYVPKHPDTIQTTASDEIDIKELKRLGKTHNLVFSPEGTKVVGLMVRRPDIAGMVKRRDVFLAIDSLAITKLGIIAYRGGESFDDAARKRMNLNWDSCLIWAGMDVKTKSDKVLGRISDISFSPITGQVTYFYISDGAVADSLVGMIKISPDLVIGHKSGYMIVSDEASSLKLSGGLAQTAGQASAKAKAKGRQAGKKASEAVGAGSFKLGRQIGRTRNAFSAFAEEFEKNSK